MALQQNPPKHFYSLDAIRGIAAIVVVLYHWQLFYYANDVFIPGMFDKNALPWFDTLSPIYMDGMISVDLFFMLSGFIFFWLYSEKIASHKMGFTKFMGFRLSRLYPIHLFTLLLMGVLQWIMVKNSGHFFIIQYNDAYHFILNIFFMQNWGFEKGPSFNGPSWSVSAEVFLYLMFFALCYLRLQNKKWVLFLLIPAGAIIQYALGVLGKGIFSFFYGGLIYYAYVWIIKENKTNKVLPILATITVCLWAYLFVEYYSSYLLGIWIKIFKQFSPGKDQEAVIKSFGYFKNQYFRSTISPCTILLLALWETKKSFLSKRWAFLGNGSYAMYLIHFPLMLIFVLIVDALKIDRQIFRSPYMMLFFFALLIPLSLITFYFFEMPVQDKIRNTFFKSKKSNVNISDVEVTT